MDQNTPADERRDEGHQRGTGQYWSFWINWERTDEIQCERCYRYMSVGHTTYCHCGRTMAGASEEVEKQTLKNVTQNFDFLPPSSFNIKRGPSRVIKYGTNKEAQEHGKAKDALKSAPHKRYRTIFERHKDDVKEWLSKDWMNTIFAHEMKKEILIVSTKRMLRKSNVGENTYFPKRNCDCARGLRKTVNTLTLKKQWKKFRLVRESDPSATQLKQPPQQHTPTSQRQPVGITNHGVMINGSHRRALIGKRTNSNKRLFFFRRLRSSTLEDSKGMKQPIVIFSLCP